jgi:hypothetical protein
MLWRREKSLALTGILTSEAPARSTVTILTELFLFPIYYINSDAVHALRGVTST